MLFWHFSMSALLNLHLCSCENMKQNYGYDLNYTFYYFSYFHYDQLDIFS